MRAGFAQQGRRTARSRPAAALSSSTSSREEEPFSLALQFKRTDVEREEVIEALEAILRLAPRAGLTRERNLK